MSLRTTLRWLPARVPAGIDIVPEGTPGARGHKFQKKLFDNGLHVKATGDCVIIAPPLIAERQRKSRQPVAGFDFTVSVPRA